MTARIPIGNQISEVARELALRRNVYPKRVSDGKMRQGEADLLVARMEAVLATLKWCETHEADIRAWLAEKKDPRT